jgi:signal peptidase I
MVLEVSSAPAPGDLLVVREEILPVKAQPVIAPVVPHLPLVSRKVLYVALAFCVFGYVVTHWILWPVKIDGQSMTPNYDDGQPAIINRLAYLASQPRRGDVVGLRVGHEFYLKRIVGLPGEHIEFHRGTVMVNGRPLKESYAVKPLLWQLAPAQLGANDYYVMGDNRTQSKLGPVTRDKIIGKSLF